MSIDNAILIIYYTSWLRLNDRGIEARVPVGLRLSHAAQTDSVPHPASYPIGTKDISSGIKRPRCEGNHFSPSKENVDLYIPSQYSFTM